jgi:hypothetical protein
MPRPTEPPAGTNNDEFATVKVGAVGWTGIATWVTAVAHQLLATYSFEIQNELGLLGSTIVVEFRPQRYTPELPELKKPVLA